MAGQLNRAIRQSESQQTDLKNATGTGIVQAISPLVGGAGVSIEVFAALDTTAEEMLAQGQEMFSWIPNAYIKYPCTHEGLRADQMSVREGLRVNMTLCFSQEQAASRRRLECPVQSEGNSTQASGMVLFTDGMQQCPGARCRRPQES